MTARRMQAHLFRKHDGCLGAGAPCRWPGGQLNHLDAPVCIYVTHCCRLVRTPRLVISGPWSSGLFTVYAAGILTTYSHEYRYVLTHYLADIVLVSNNGAYIVRTVFAPPIKSCHRMAFITQFIIIRTVVQFYTVLYSSIQSGLQCAL